MTSPTDDYAAVNGTPAHESGDQHDRVVKEFGPLCPCCNQRGMKRHGLGLYECVRTGQVYRFHLFGDVTPYLMLPIPDSDAINFARDMDSLGLLKATDGPLTPEQHPARHLALVNLEKENTR